jgi:hypothetical protein
MRRGGGRHKFNHSRILWGVKQKMSFFHDTYTRIYEDGSESRGHVFRCKFLGAAIAFDRGSLRLYLFGVQLINLWRGGGFLSL